MKIHIDLQHNGLEPLMNDNDINDTDLNENLQDGNVISATYLLNSHTLHQDN